MHRIAATLLPLLWAVSSPAVAAAPWRLLATEASTDAAEIRVGDILQPVSIPGDANSEIVWREISCLVVAVHRDGQPVTRLSADRLAKSIASRLPGQPSVVITGPAELPVHRTPVAAVVQTVGWPSSPLAQPAPDEPWAAARGGDAAKSRRTAVEGSDRDRLGRLILAAIDQDSSPPGYDLDVTAIELAEVADPATAPPVRHVDDVSIDSDWPDWSATAGPATRSVQFTGGGGRGELRDGWAIIELRPRPAIWVTDQSIRRGDPMSPASLRAQPRRGDRPVAGAISDPAQVQGLEASRNLRAGETITDDLLTPIRWVRRGELVSVRVVAGGITVTTDGKAIGQGGQDELIEVETLDPRRRLLARVTAPQVVEAIAHGVKTR